MKFLTGIAVPFNEPAALYESPLGAYYESFRPGSLSADLAGRTIPLLLEHVGHEPIGKIRKAWDSDDGLMIEATLAGRVDHVADLVDNDILDRLSIGFTIDPHADDWTQTQSGVPAVVRRNAELREVSLTWRPAYTGAVVGSLADHSTDWAADRALVTELRMWHAADRRKQAQLHAVS
jgi:HK97 family phage prohead protease